MAAHFEIEIAKSKAQDDQDGRRGGGPRRRKGTPVEFVAMVGGRAGVRVRRPPPHQEDQDVNGEE